MDLVIVLKAKTQSGRFPSVGARQSENSGWAPTIPGSDAIFHFVSMLGDAFDPCKLPPPRPFITFSVNILLFGLLWAGSSDVVDFSRSLGRQRVP